MQWLSDVGAAISSAAVGVLPTFVATLLVGLVVALFAQKIASRYQRRSQIFQLKHETYVDFLNAYSRLKNESIAMGGSYRGVIEEQLKHATTPDQRREIASGIILPGLDSKYLDARQDLEQFLARFAVFKESDELLTELQKLLETSEAMTRLERSWFVPPEGEAMPRTNVRVGEHVATHLRTMTRHFSTIVSAMANELYNVKR